MTIVYRKDQKKIMEYTSGTMGIQAVPGAGKTFIITNLVAKLLGDMQKKNSDGRILVLTYMNSAANNFKSRIRKILKDREIEANNFDVMTIHSLAMKIIKENTNLALIDDETEIIDDYKKNIFISESIHKFKEIDDNELKIQYFLSKENRNKKNIVDKWEKEFNSIVLNSIKLLKYANIDDERLKKIISENYRGIMSLISPIYSNYQEALRLSGYLDYDDILIMAYNLLENNEHIAKKYQEKYLYVFEDECQDSNLIQGKIIDIISSGKNNIRKSKKNLVRVGDVNQSITGTFTGSNPKYFIEFCKNADYTYNMNIAGRSSKDIINLANELVRYVNCDKSNAYYNSLENLYIEEVEKNKGYKENPTIDKYLINTVSLNDYYEELDKIISVCNYFKREYPNFSIGILSFSNFDIDLIAEKFDSTDLVYEKLGGDSKQRKKIINDLKNIFDFLVNPNNQENFKDLIVNCFIERFDNIVITDEEKADIINILMDVSIENMVYSIDYRKNIYKKISFVLDNDVERQFINKLDKSIDILKEICEYSQSNISKLISFICSKLDLSDEENLLSNYIVFYIDRLEKYGNLDIDSISIYFDKRFSRVFDTAIDSIYDLGEKEIEPGSITIATLHKSKGMEWDAVIITGVNSSDFPSGLDDFFRIDRKYLRNGYKYPEAFINREIDLIIGNTVREMLDYEIDLKKDLIAERVRLLYVGITRAKKSLLVLNSKQKYVESIKKNIKRSDSEFLVAIKQYIANYKKMSK